MTPDRIELLTAPLVLCYVYIIVYIEVKATKRGIWRDASRKVDGMLSFAQRRQHQIVSI